MYAQYRCIEAAPCLALPDGRDAGDGASSFVNPLTALGMVETMRREGHTALVHTAAASNLGQMLNRICIEDSIAAGQHRAQAGAGRALRAAGATYVCNSSAPSFLRDLTQALVATGGHAGVRRHRRRASSPSQILTRMEAALGSRRREYSRYGSTTHKQVYIYGGLDRGPTELNRTSGWPGVSAAGC